MRDIQTTYILSSACAALTFVSLCVCLMLRSVRAGLRNYEALALQFESELTDARRDLSAVSRRMASLESRRIAGAGGRLPAEESVAPSSSKPNMTERRHRVTQLARRGVDCGMIAEMLNMPHGEVELMIGLSRAG